MMKRILLALALAVSIGGAVAACNNPSGTSNPGASTGTAPSLDTGGSSSGTGSSEPPAASMEALPSAS
jgi:hypothetical protein